MNPKLSTFIIGGTRACSILILAFLVMASAIAFGQVTTTQVTLGAAQAASDSTITLSTNTCADCVGGVVTARGSVNATQTALMVDGEFEEINQFVSGTTWTVIRGAQGSKRQPHNNAAVVWIGPPSGPFPLGPNPNGACSSTTPGYNPVVPTQSGIPFGCTKDQNSAYRYYGYVVLPPGTAGSSSTIVAPGPFFHVTGVTTVNTITPPPGFIGGCIYIVSDGGGWATGTGGNIAAAVTISASRMATFCYDYNTSKWYQN